MRQELSAYLESIRSGLWLDPGQEQEIIQELGGHLEDEVAEMRWRGVEEAEALRQATARFGTPAVVAQEMYRLHSQGGWCQAFLAALPHLLVALSFALQLWHNPLWLGGLLLAVVAVSLWGWVQGKPLWLFPWLGYSIIPLMGISLFLLSLPPWSYLAVLAYLMVAWWLLASIARLAVRRDWLYGSLVLLPFPVLAGWLLALQLRTGLAEGVLHGLEEASPWIALTFVTLALTTATFVRVSQRRLRTGALLTPELLILVLVALGTANLWGFLGLMLLALCSLGLLLSPALLRRGLRRDPPK